MSKRYRAIIVCEAHEQAKVDSVFQYITSINMHDVGEHPRCTLKITGIDITLNQHGENAGKIVLTVDCIGIKLTELPGIHRFRDFTKLFPPDELKEIPSNA